MPVMVSVPSPVSMLRFASVRLVALPEALRANVVPPMVTVADSPCSESVISPLTLSRGPDALLPPGRSDSYTVAPADPAAGTVMVGTFLSPITSTVMVAVEVSPSASVIV